MSYEVGKLYSVPCIKTVAVLKDGWRPIWRGEFIPVTGPLHRDVGPVNFPWLHWHVDLRFVSAAVYKTLGDGTSEYSMPVQKHPLRWHEGGHYNSKENLNDSFVEGDVVQRRLKCKRVLPVYPYQQARWLPKLECELKDAKLKGMVCPHRGIPLDGCPIDADVVTCPGHGLRWNVKTGELVPG